MIHDHALMIYYQKYDQEVHIQRCIFIVLHAACSGHLNEDGHNRWPNM